MTTDFYVYVCFRPWDGSPCYVGKGQGKRWNSFPKNRNKKLLAIVAEAGGKIPSVKIRDGLSEAEAFEIEIAFIKAIGRGEEGPLVNATKGGEGTFGFTFTNSDETRRKKSIVAAQRTYSDETRAKISSKAKGRKVSDEARAKMSAARRGKPKTAEWAAKIGAAHRGRPKTAEQKRKQSETMRGRTLSEDHKKNIGEGLRRFKERITSSL